MGTTGFTKPSSAQTPLQSIYQDDQNFKIDINQIYKDWITPLDAIRSRANLSANKAILYNLNSASDLPSILKLVKMEDTPQESRCHAFFRLLGFPVISSSNTFYNPGHDITSAGLANKNQKFNIADFPIDGFNALSEARENYTQTELAIFANPNTIDAAVLALSSGGNFTLRKFIVPLNKDSSPFGNLTAAAQSYTIDTDSLVGDNIITLDEYQDSSGDNPSEVTLSDRFHIIKPFIVDARIDTIVSPQANLVAVPFVPDNSFCKISATTTVVRPLIEKVIRDRLVIVDPTSAGSNIAAITDFVKSVPEIQNSQLINIITSGPYKQNDQVRFIDNVNTIRTMMQTLVKAQHDIKKAQGLYYCVPVPSLTGPEGGVTVQGNFYPQFLDPRLVTDLDLDIVTALAKAAINNLNSDSAQSAAANDPKNFTNKTTFGPDTSSGLGDNNATNMESLTQARTRLLNKAGTALQTIEIIMGEFSGFGLCDIVAIIGALNIMDVGALVGLLDDAAYARMQTLLPTTSGAARSDIVTAMTELTSRVKDFYNLMDSIYQDIYNNGAN